MRGHRLLEQLPGIRRRSGRIRPIDHRTDPSLFLGFRQLIETPERPLEAIADFLVLAAQIFVKDRRLSPRVVGENKNSDPAIASSGDVFCRWPDFHGSEVPALPPDLPKTLDQRFDFGIARPGRDMHGDGCAFLGADAGGRDRSIRPAQVHSAPDQRERSEQDHQGEFDDRIERLLLGRRGSSWCCCIVHRRHGQGRAAGYWPAAPSSGPASSRSPLSAKRATATTRSSSPSRSRILTPCVLRPISRISPTLQRSTLPCAAISMISSLSLTCKNPTANPLRSVVLTLMMPLPPRPWTRYSPTGVRFPYPPSVTVRTAVVESGVIVSIPMTQLPSSSVMPLTPYAVRPMGRTSLSEKRMVMPCFVPRSISRWPSVTCTPMSLSPSSSPSAIMPPCRGLLYAESSVFLMRPFLVAMTTNRSSG